MNYLKIMEKHLVNSKYAIGKLYCQEREEVFRYYFYNKKVVPPFIVFESIFQTAAAVIRFKYPNRKQIVIASVRNFHFDEVILPNQEIIICTELKAEQTNAFYFVVSLSVQDKSILSNGALILHS